MDRGPDGVGTRQYVGVGAATGVAVGPPLDNPAPGIGIWSAVSAGMGGASLPLREEDDG